MGERLNTINQIGNSIFRIGGDEFAVITSNCYDKEAAEKLAQNIIDRLCEDVIFDNQKLRLGASVGIAQISGNSASSVFINADAALYSAKADGKTTFRCYRPGMESRPSRIEF